MWNHSLRRRAAAGLALAVVLTSSTAALAAPPSEPAPGAYTTNGTVSAIAHASGRTYVGGDFTRVGPRSGAGVTLTANGALSAFPVRAEVAGGEVRAVVSDGAGGWYIGGSFTWVGGQRRLALARIRSDGTVDTTFAPAVADIAGNPGEVNALVLSRPGPDGARTLYVGGRFRQIRSGNDRTFHHNLAALDAGDGAERTFKVFIGGCQSSEPECSSAVRALALGYVALPVEGVSPDPPQPILFVAGDFTRIGVDIDPYTVAGLAAVRGIGSVGPTNLKTSGQVVAHFPAGADPVPVAWNPSPSSVYAMQAGEPAPPSASPTTSLVVYVGGQNTEKTAPVAKALQLQLNKSSHTATSTGVQFNSWRPAPVGCAGCAVRALALDGQRVYFGGDFDRIGTGAGQKPAGRLGKIAAIANAQDTSVSAAGEPLGPGVDGPVRALAWSAGRP
ncbi:MAG TPA: delta-60 repeat domain-containing protein, partial [Solirubrobacteraceae bacterium]|nr:delta-60 repeat domain-containing protein [Solirubrobacteraceae bacterium]